MKILNLNLKYYLMLPWKRPTLRVDAITWADARSGQLIITREFFSLRTWVTHYVWEAQQLFKKFHFRVIWMPVYKFAGTDLELKIPHIHFTIAVDATSTGAVGSSSISWSHTCTGSNLTLVVPAKRASDATYNSASMTAGTGSVLTTIFYKINPSTGAHNVVVNGSSPLFGCSISFTGSNQSSIGANAADNGSATTAVATSGDNSYVVQCVSCDNSLSGNSDTLIVNAASGTAKFGAQYKSVPTQTTPSLSWTAGANPNSSILEVKNANQTFAKTASASTSRAASRSISLSALEIRVRSLAASVSIAAGRSITVSRFVDYSRSLSASVSNAVSRLAELAYELNHGFTRALSVTVSVAASRLATLERLFTAKRSASVTSTFSSSVTRAFVFAKTAAVSVSNAVSRLATVAFASTWARSISVAVSNAAGRVAALYATLNGLPIPSWTKISKPIGDLWTKLTKPNT